MDQLTIQQYLERIHYTGPLEPTLETLCNLQFNHLLYIPYENLDLHCGRSILVEDLKAIKAKVLDRRRGGYCVELNQLFLQLLQAIGYHAEAVFSRGTKGVIPGQERAQTHVILIVTIASMRYVADVGGSTIGSPWPLCLEHTDLQLMNSEEHRILPISERHFRHQYRHEDGSWHEIKSFNVESLATVADCEAINWYSCTHRNSRHPNNAILTIQTIGGMKTMQNNEYGIRTGSTKSVKRVIETLEEYLSILKEDFLMPVEDLGGLKVPQTQWNIVA